MEISKYVKQLCKEKDISKRLLVYLNMEKADCFKSPNGRNGEKILPDVEFISLLKSLVLDLSSNDDELIEILLSILGTIFASEKLQQLLQSEGKMVNDLLDLLVDIVASTKSNTIIERILHILVVQRFPESVMCLFVESFLVAVPITGCSVDCGYMKMINKFVRQCPNDMNENVSLWIKTLLQLSSHSQVTVRQLAVETLNENLEIILNNKKKILSLCANLLKTEVLPNLKSLCNKSDVLQEVLSFQLPMYMSIIGEDYKRSSSLSNSLLQLVEKGFIHSEEAIKICAFQAWSCLIQCFAGNKELLASPKYCKLFTQPLKLKLKSEALIRALIETMWKLAVCLDDALPELFETLCVPLLEICFGGPKTMIQSRRSSGRLSLSKHLSPYENIQVLGAEMLARFSSAATEDLNHKFSLEPLHKPFFGQPTVFARFHSTLMPAICDTICHLNPLLPVEFLWQLWAVVLKCTQEIVTRKRDIEIFRSVCQSAHRIVKSDLSSQFLLSIVSSLTTFPSKILNSSLHYFSDSTVDAMHGTPVITVLQLLMSKQVCKGNLSDPKFFDCAKFVVACGMERQIATLEFIRSVIKYLSTDDVVFLNIWIFLSHQVTEYMIKTLNVNEGDSLEHDFSTLYEALVYPFRLVFNSKVCLDSSTTETALSSWSNMFTEFVSCTTKIPTTKPNEARYHVASQLYTIMDSMQDSVLQESQLQFFEVVSLKIVTGADFSEVKLTHKKKSRQKSNSIQEKKGEKHLEGFNLIVSQLLCCLEKKSENEVNASKLPNIMPCLHHIFSNIPQSLVKPFFLCFAKVLSSYLAEAKSLLKPLVSAMEEVWHQTLLRLLFENSLFSDENVSELFAVAISQSTEPVYQFCVEFWEMKALDALDASGLPEEFLKILGGMYRKEGFSMTWKEQETADEEIDLNVSVVSDQSNTEEEIETVSESDVTGESNTSNDVIVLNDTEEDDDDITQLDQYRTTLESTSSDSFSDAVLDTSVSEASTESHNRSVSLRPFANYASSDNELCDQHVEKKLEDPPKRQSERLKKLKKSNESDKEFSNQVIPSDFSTDDFKAEATASKDSLSSISKSRIDVKDFMSEDEDSEPSCQVISDSEEDRTDASWMEGEKESYISASEELDSEQDVTPHEDDINPVPQEQSIYEDVIMANVSINLNSPTNDIKGPTSDEGSSGCAEESVKKGVQNFHEESAVHKVDHQEDRLPVVDTAAEESVYEEIEMVDSSMHSAPDQSMTLDVSRETHKQKEDEDTEEEVIYVEMAEISICPPSNPEEDSSFANECSETNENVSSACDEERLPDESIYEIIEVGEMSMNTENQFLEVSVVQEDTPARVPLPCTSSNEPTSAELPPATLASPLPNKPSVESSEKTNATNSALKISEHNRPGVENSSPNVATENLNAEQSLCTSKLSCDLSQSKNEDEKLNNSFDECAQELGVQPLDSSFETQEHADHDAVGSPENSLKDDDKNAGAEDVIKDSLAIEESENLSMKENNEVISSSTTHRRSSRKRLSTSLLNSNANKPKRGRKARTKLQVQQPAAEDDEQEPVQDVSLTAETNACSLSDDVDGGKAVSPNADVFTFEESNASERVTTVETVSASNEQTHVEIQMNSSDQALGVSGVDDNAERATKNLDNCNELSSIPETNMMDSPQSTGQPKESIDTPKSCLGKRLSLLRGEEVSPIGSPNSILKKRLADALSPATKSRRVSFAEPISTSTTCDRETVIGSPASSPRDWRKTKSSHRVVSRRLSLPAPQRATHVIEAPSPMSVRSANVAAVIADIKARGNTECSTLNQSPPSSSLSVSPRKPAPAVGTIRVSQLNNIAFLKSLSSQQLSELMENVLEATSTIYSVLKKV